MGQGSYPRQASISCWSLCSSRLRRMLHSVLMDKGRTLVQSAGALSGPVFGSPEVKETSFILFLDFWAVALSKAQSTSEPLSGLFCPVESSGNPAEWEWSFAQEVKVGRRDWPGRACFGWFLLSVAGDGGRREWGDMAVVQRQMLQGLDEGGGRADVGHKDMLDLLPRRSSYVSYLLLGGGQCEAGRSIHHSIITIKSNMGYGVKIKNKKTSDV